MVLNAYANNKSFNISLYWLWNLSESDGEDPVLEIWGVLLTPLLQLPPDPLWHGGWYFPVKFPCMGQIDPFENYLY